MRPLTTINYSVMTLNQPIQVTYSSILITWHIFPISLIFRNSDGTPSCLHRPMHPTGMTLGVLFYYSAHLAGIFKQMLHSILESLSSRRFRGHERRPEVTRANVHRARTPLLKFKIEREILVFEISRLGKNYSQIVGLQPRKNPSAIFRCFQRRKNRVNSFQFNFWTRQVDLASSGWLQNSNKVARFTGFT